MEYLELIEVSKYIFKGGNLDSVVEIAVGPEAGPDDLSLLR